MNVLVVVDMQNDFIDGALGTAEAQAIVPNVVDYINNFYGIVIATMDTHQTDYLKTQEGQKLPVVHCIDGSQGHEIQKDVLAAIKSASGYNFFKKNTFGSTELARDLVRINSLSVIESITFIGVCTDICVISNALLTKAYLPEVPIKVDAKCCAGVTVESHNNALEAMKMCQIEVLNG